MGSKLLEAKMNIDYIYEHGKKMLENILKRKLMRTELFLDFYCPETNYTYIPSNREKGSLIKNTNDSYFKIIETDIEELDIRLVKFEVKNTATVFMTYAILKRHISQ